MRTIAIFALFLVASCDTTIIKECPRKVTVSPLQPVKFWPIDCQTYNEKEVCGINPKCWCQPFECDDVIRAQFLDDPGSFVLKVFGEDNEEITVIDFDAVADEDSEGTAITFDLSSFTNEDIPGNPLAVAWTLGSSPSVSLTPAQDSKRLTKVVSLSAGTYKIKYNVSVPASMAEINSVLQALQFLDGSDAAIAAAYIPNGVHDIEVTFPDDVASMFFKFASGDTGSGMVKIKSLKFIPIGFSQIYSASFIPSEEGICDQQIKLKIVKTNPLPAFSTWEEQTGGGLVTGWEITDTPEIDIPGPAGAGIFKNITGYIAGSYKIHWKITVTNTGISVATIDFTKSGVSVVDPADVFAGNTSSGNLSGPGTYEGDFEFDLTDSPDKILFNVANFAANTKHFTVDELDILVNPAPDVEVYKSDCLDIRESHPCSELFQYKNNRNYNGLAFNQGSPDTTFNIRIPMVFFHERGQEEDLVSEDNQQTIHLSGKDVEQRIISTDYMPYYMHHRFRKILKMQTVFADETFWTKEASYDIQEGRKDYPLKRAECWLTKKTSIVRSIL